MQIINFEAKIDKVALLAEGVDRNNFFGQKG